jgi:hypothetical protein
MTNAGTQKDTTLANSRSGRTRYLKSILQRDARVYSTENATEYACDECSERCINPADSFPAREGLCVNCLAALVATGSTRRTHLRRQGL